MNLKEEVKGQLVILSMFTFDIDNRRLRECWQKFDLWSQNDTKETRQELKVTLNKFEARVKLDGLKGSQKLFRFKNLLKFGRKAS